MKGLAKEGHQVTVVSPFKQQTPIKNYNEVFLENSWEMSRKSKYSIDIEQVCRLNTKYWICLIILW